MAVSVSDKSRYLAEFVGTYVLVLTIGMNVLGATTIWAVLSISAALMVMIYALGSVSGAHFNPAVTLAVAVCNKMPGGWASAGYYMLTQVFAGVLAALTYTAIFGESFNLQPGKGHSMTQAAIVEVIYTFMLCFTVLNVACASAARDNQYFGLAIGFVIIAGGYAGGSISGGAFNPAVALGIDLSSFMRGFGASLAYVAVQAIGALLAAFAFRTVRAEDFGGEKQSLLAKLTAELIGTYLLTVTVGFNVLSATAAAALSIAASLMCMVYAVGSISGAHLNPAVTFGIWLAGRNKIDFNLAWKYVVAQTLGGILAGCTFVGTLNRSFNVGPATTWGAAVTAEAIFTGYLTFVVLSIATSKSGFQKDFFGLAIGMVITVAGFAIGGVSGAFLNPAVAIGADFGDLLKGGKFGNSLAYTGAQLGGAAVAAAAYSMVRPNEYATQATKAK